MHMEGIHLIRSEIQMSKLIIPYLALAFMFKNWNILNRALAGPIDVIVTIFSHRTNADHDH